MKFIKYFLIFFLFAACGSLKKNKTAYFTTSEKVEKDMNFLASDELEGRDTGTGGIEAAATFIENVFESNKVKPFFDSFKDSLSNYEKPAYNIVGYLKGRDKELSKEFIIIGAHYDHIGIENASRGDSIANGANDNASGTTAVLEIAKYFSSAKSNKRSILFVLFSAEEKGLLGSEHLAKRLKNQNLDLYVMLNFEMIGVPMVDKDYLLYLSGYERSNMAATINLMAGEELIGFLPKAKEFSLFQRSDNFPFHKVFNLPAQTFSSFDFTNFDYYHKPGDEVELMDFDHMVKVINKMIPAIEEIANTEERVIKYN
ncbi:MAG: M20/M25/M40 family metallo-hydrolase [Eudoraea sp.]